jgi:hypothetical protein
MSLMVLRLNPTTSIFFFACNKLSRKKYVSEKWYVKTESSSVRQLKNIPISEENV